MTAEKSRYKERVSWLCRRCYGNVNTSSRRNTLETYVHDSGDTLQGTIVETFTPQCNAWNSFPELQHSRIRPFGEPCLERLAPIFQKVNQNEFPKVFRIGVEDSSLVDRGKPLHELP